jgi:hypothetical protein
VRYQDGDAAGALATAEEAGTLARALADARSEVRALHVALWSRWLAGESGASAAPEEVERLAAAVGDDESVALLFSLMSTALGRAGRRTESVAAARRGLEIARRVGSLRAQLEVGEELVEALTVSGSPREAIAVADEVRADTADLDLVEPPRLAGELALALATAGETERAIAVANDVVEARRGAPAPVHAAAGILAANALLAAGRVPDRAFIDAERPSCRSCDRNWLGVAGRQAALSGDAARALGLAAELEAAGGPPHAVAHVRALAHARAGRADESERAAEQARSGYRGADRADLEDRVDREIALISAIHA